MNEFGSGWLKKKVYIRKPDFDDCFVIAIVEMRGDKRAIGYPENGEWTFVEYSPSCTVAREIEEKLLKIPYEWAMEIYEQLGEYIKPKGPTATEQELKATRFHLEDMRALVFKTGKPEEK